MHLASFGWLVGSISTRRKIDHFGLKIKISIIVHQSESK
jgi:hypothetical protein